MFIRTALAIAFGSLIAQASTANDSLSEDQLERLAAIKIAADNLAQTQNYQPALQAAAQATAFYKSQVPVAHQRFLRTLIDHCLYDENSPAQCVDQAHKDYRAGWAISETSLPQPPLMTRVRIASEHCGGAGFSEYSYVQYQPEDSLAKKRINALLEPLVVADDEEQDDEGNCVANEFNQTQQLLHATERYLGVYESGWTYFYRAAHPLPFASMQHLDPSRGMVWDNQSIFANPQMNDLIAPCLATLIKATDIEADDYMSMYGEDVAAAFSDANRWQFTPTEAKIEFAPYEAAAYAYGFMHCEYPLEALKPYLHENFYSALLGRPHNP